MARKRSMSLAALAVGALVGALGVVGTSAAPPVRADATAVIHWNEVAVNTLAAIPGPNGGAPPALQINMGMVEGAVYDAVNTIGPRQHRPYLLKRRFGAKASIDAAVATAAYDVLTDIVSNAGPPFRSPVTRQICWTALATEYAASLAAVDAGSFKTARHHGRPCSRRSDARGTSGRRPVRAISVGAELRPRALAAAPQLLPGSRSSTRPRGRAG